MGGEQSSLFSAKDLQGSYSVDRPVELAISQTALQEWKQRVFHHQQAIAAGQNLHQGALFDLPGTGDLADGINPFALPRQNSEFWRWRVEDEGVSALYFVMDDELPLLLYVGETVKSNLRWKGEHDCKRYTLNYVSAHRAHRLPVNVNIGFWAEAPVHTRPRQQLESALINKWRSPFNKENWDFWKTPFVHGKK